MSAPPDLSDPLREELDRLHQTLKENQEYCAEARAHLEARRIAEKDHHAERDRNLMEIRGKLHDMIEHGSHDNETANTRYQADASVELLLEATRQAHHEALTAIADFAEENRAQQEVRHEELCRLIRGHSNSGLP